MIDSVDALTRAARQMEPGMRVDLEIPMRSLFPRPPVTGKDDYLDERERGIGVMRMQGYEVDFVERLDPPSWFMELKGRFP